MSKGTLTGNRELARKFFHQSVMGQLRTSACPSEQFIDDCFNANLSVGETLKIWSQRLA